MLSIEVENRIRQMNPWIINPENTETFVRRFIPENYVLRKIENYPLRADRAMLVVGPRQAGKSTSAWHQLLKLLPEVLILNMDDPLLRSQLIHAIDFIEHIQKNYSFFFGAGGAISPLSIFSQSNPSKNLCVFNL